METSVITVNKDHVCNGNLEIFVETGSDKVPFVTLRENTYFPPVIDVYAREKEHPDTKTLGVHVSIRLEHNPDSTRGGIQFNLTQEGLNPHARYYRMPC